MRCGLNINWASTEVIRPKFQTKYAALGPYGLAHSTGVDTSKVLIVRAGVRGDNDLIWVCGAPNVAAKLSAIRESGYSSYVNQAVYDVANNEAKTGENGEPMWEQRTWSELPEIGYIYRSSWWWRP